MAPVVCDACGKRFDADVFVPLVDGKNSKTVACPNCGHLTVMRK